MFRDKAKDGTVRLTGGASGGFPVGAIYMTIDPTNPSAFFGGTWVRYANGRVIVGIDENDADFDLAGRTGGAKTVALGLEQTPQHVHYQTTSFDGSSIFSTRFDGSILSRVVARVRGQVAATQATANTRQDSTFEAVTYPNAPAAQGHSNVQPYLACYIWRRTA